MCWTDSWKFAVGTYSTYFLESHQIHRPLHILQHGEIARWRSWRSIESVMVTTATAMVVMATAVTAMAATEEVGPEEGRWVRRKCETWDFAFCRFV